MESHYQKDFLPGMSGTFEHIVEMSDIINDSRKQQRSVTVTSMDLKNAFGEVHHSLIQSVLCYHYRPDKINCVKALHSDFRLSISTNDFHTKYIAVEKSVLQGYLISSFFKKKILSKTPLYNMLEKKISLTLGIVHSKVFFHVTGFSSQMMV